MALFITFEGGEGSGKDTQAHVLVERLRKQKKWGVSYAQEPGTTPIGKRVREWLSEPDRPLTIIPGKPTQLSLDITNDKSPIHLQANSPLAELLVFTLARSQLVEDFIIPKLRSNSIVVCNRYADSTTAYQGYGRGLDLKLVELANNIATQGTKPNLTILLDLPPENGLIRKFGVEIKDNFENAELNFHKKVREGYLKLAAAEPERWLVIDATQPKDEIAKIIWERVRTLLSAVPPPASA